MRNAPRQEDGFTLGETLIAVALTLVVLSAAVETMGRSMGLANSSRIISSTNHGLQAAMSLMVRDMMQTGQGIPIGGVPLPNGAGALPLFRPGATASLTFPAGTTELPALLPGDGLGPNLLGTATDVVSILYADRTLNINANPLTAIAVDGSTMTVNAATPINGVGGIRAGDLILFSNALGNALQLVTADPVGQVVTFDLNDPMRLNQRAAPEGTIMNLRDAGGNFPPTTATRVLMMTYFIDVQTDPLMPRLVRRLNMGNMLAIAMGTENIQVTYDLVDGVTDPTAVATPPVGNSPNQIRKANLFLLARSQDVDRQSGEHFRNSMQTQVGLRSLSFVDRYR